MIEVFILCMLTYFILLLPRDATQSAVMRQYVVCPPVRDVEV